MEEENEKHVEKGNDGSVGSCPAAGGIGYTTAGCIVKR